MQSIAIGVRQRLAATENVGAYYAFYQSVLCVVVYFP
jgi:hypothetical protein